MPFHEARFAFAEIAINLTGYKFSGLAVCWIPNAGE